MQVSQASHLRRMRCRAPHCLQEQRSLQVVFSPGSWREGAARSSVGDPTVDLDSWMTKRSKVELSCGLVCMHKRRWCAFTMSFICFLLSDAQSCNKVLEPGNLA